MYRFLLTPRWWGINVFAALSIPLCLFMGSWQLGRFESRVDSHQEQQDHAAEAESAAVAPLAELLPVTTETSGRQARAVGRYDAARQLLVPDRSLDDREGFYVLTLLRIDGDRALPVVRGWLPGDADSPADRAKVPAVPAGEVTVVGALQASEHSTSNGVQARGGLPKGQLGMISAATLVNLVPYDVHNAWVTVTKAAAPLEPVPPAAAEGTGLDLKAFQNLGYTGEWFVFAGFVIFMWFRLFRREVEHARDVALGIVPPSDDSGPGRSDGPDSPDDPGPAAPDAASPGPAPEASAPERRPDQGRAPESAPAPEAAGATRG
ncbi:SURF1 family protein [Streptomyces sp. AC563]|uniref:SURF1 family protein n=1 Tax=Streptomyces buecherae TaxID=2763006 RepID=UPI00164DB25B|nr:SURF1 family protein [Streptomyces buecherae]MBC3990092.1 SURF1 family protein [Streptomyces buecherae]